MLTVDYTNQFNRDYKLAAKRGYDITLLKKIIRDLSEEKTLPERNKNHSLSGNYQGRMECHIKPDWLLIYRIKNGVIVFERTGTHADLF